MLWPPVRLPSFQPCFTYRPTPICSDDRGKPKGRLFLTDLSILFSTFGANDRTNLDIYIYIYLGREEKNRISARPNSAAVSRQLQTRGATCSLSLSLSLFAKEIAGLLSRIARCRVEFRSRDIDFPFYVSRTSSSVHYFSIRRVKFG